MDDKKIIELFFARSEKAIEELASKYGKYCSTISYNILKNRQDAEECVNDTWLGVWNAIPPARPNPLHAFVGKIVRNISIKRYHSNTALKRNSEYSVAMEEIEACLASRDSIEDEIAAEELSRFIEEFLDSLNRENRVIFMRRYWFSDSYADIEKKVGLSRKTISVRLTRMRKQLKIFLEERGVIV